MTILTNPKIIFWPVAVVIIHLIATLLGWYDLILWLDSPLHFIGGISIALSTYYLLRHTGAKTHTLVFFLAIIGTTALTAVFWEFVEFSGDYIASNAVMQPSIGDTMKDLFIGISGGSIVALSLYLQRKHK